MKACDLVYAYYVYKLECEAKGVGNTDIAADLRRSLKEGNMGTFNEFIRHVISHGKHNDIVDISKKNLDTLRPDVGWIRHNLDVVRFPCPDFKRLHKHIKQPTHPSEAILVAYDAITKTFENLVTEKHSIISSSLDMEGARDAAKFVWLMRPGSSDTALRQYLESLQKNDGSSRYVVEGLYDIETSEGYESCSIDKDKMVEEVRLKHGQAEAGVYRARLDADVEAFWAQKPDEGGLSREELYKALEKKAKRVYDIAHE